MADRGPGRNTWIRVSLLDSNGKPAPGVAYRLRTPGGESLEGTTDVKGQIFIDPIEPGECEVSFPDLDADEWTRG